MAGAIAGAVLAASGLLQPVTEQLPPGTVARVGTETIHKQDYLHLVNLMAEARRSPMNDGEKRRILDRLIEEKLLIQRGIELGLPWSESGVSKSLVNAMIDTIIAEAGTSVPTDKELENFLRENRDYFQPAPRLRVRQMVFRGENAAGRASLAYRRLQTENWQVVAANLADRSLPELPGSLLPQSKLRDYLGAELSARAMAIKPGAISEPVATAAGYSLLQVLGHEVAASPTLQQIRKQVLQEYQRRASDRALRDYLDKLREESSVVIDEDFLQQLTTPVTDTPG